MISRATHQFHEFFTSIRRDMEIKNAVLKPVIWRLGYIRWVKRQSRARLNTSRTALSQI